MASEESEYKDTLQAVERGDDSAKTKLAWYFLSGYCGAKVDVDKAVVLLEERAEEDDTEAMWMLGLCCEYGMGTEQDIERAETLYKRSRDKGNEIGKYFARNRGSGRGNGVLGKIGL